MMFCSRLDTTRSNIRTTCCSGYNDRVTFGFFGPPAFRLLGGGVGGFSFSSFSFFASSSSRVIVEETIWIHHSDREYEETHPTRFHRLCSNRIYEMQMQPQVL